MLKLGINYCDNSTYHSDRTYISSSGLKLILNDPFQYYKRYIKPDLNFESVGSTAMDLGSYVHSLILEPDQTDNDFAIWDGVRRGEAWKEFAQQNMGKIIIKRDTATLGENLSKNALSNKSIIKLLDGTESEFTYCTELNGINVKVRADSINLAKNYILDVKTTNKPLTKDALMSSIASFDYDLSAALYVDCFKQINKVEKMDFYFLFVNTKDSQDSAVFKASDLLIQNGRKKYRKAIKRLIELNKTQKWIKDEIEEIDLPFWALLPAEENE